MNSEVAAGTDNLNSVVQGTNRNTDGKVGAVLVVGSGIAGIQSALELADSGFKVYLLDSAPAIGGVMAMLDKTFPTNDCSMCILAPKLVGTGRHPNIELINCAELLGLEGEPGNFTVRISQKPRYVVLDKCTGCLDCTKVCPVRVPDTYNQGLAQRGAVYKLFAQAIPNAVAIDKNIKRAPCRLACPAGVNAQGYIALTRAGKFKEAYQLVRERLPFVGICGRVCHHPCEEKCNRQQINGEQPVAIRTIKRFLADYVSKHGGLAYQVPEKPEGNTARVAVIGAGPAGLTCALDLRLKGYEVTLFEATNQAGGMMRWGIPAYRLPRTVLDQEIKNIIDTGIELKLNTPVKTTAELKQLFEQGYRAVFIALGACRSRSLNIPGMEFNGVLHGIEFLRQVNRGESPVIGKRVVVIGGGNVAVDVAMCARRCGAEEVTMVCLEKREEMPAHPWEIEEALAEGINIMPGWGPAAIQGENGVVTGLKTVECTRVFDEERRFNPEYNPQNTCLVPADTVILAIGQQVAADGFEGIERGPGGTFQVDPITLQVKGLDGVFAGGDLVSGPASVIEAVQAGHEAAISIDRFIKGEDLSAGRLETRPEGATVEDSAGYRIGIKPQPRTREPVLSPSERRHWEELNLGFNEEQAKTEAQRCLDCGVCCECFQCVNACEAKAIDHNQKEKHLELKVGAVILAGGFREYKPIADAGLGYGRHPNIVTSLEFERILSATGPYEGHVRRPSDLAQPKKIAWIQCVGSRNQEHYYCSSVCCMFATKEAVIAKEHCLGDLECHIYYMDMRCFGKGFERYYERAEKEYGVVFRRARISSIKPVSGSGDLSISYEDEQGMLRDEVYNLVVLSSALVPNPEMVALCERLGIKLDSQGFVRTGADYPVATSRAGIFACGVLTEPKDIPETVTEATGCAGAVAGLLSTARNTLVSKKSYPPERDVSEEEPRVGVFVCNCGINIGGVVRVPEVVEYAKTLPGVVYAEENLFTCSQDTQEKIKRIIKEHRLNRVVVASCTPRTHEPLFQETLAEAGLNRHLFTMANIRDQCSWVHMHLPQEATAKAKELVKMAVANARRLKPLVGYNQPVVQKALVIGGGIAGMTAALAIAEQGFEVFLVEKEKELGGNLRKLRYDETGTPTAEIIARLETKLRSNPKVRIFTGAEISAVSGYLGNYHTTVRISEPGSEETLEHGVFVVAVGAKEYVPKEYFYGEDPRVLTQLELEQRIEQQPDFLTLAADSETASSGAQSQNPTVVMIQCVGSRNENHPWCSRVCCTEAIKNALRLKKQTPNVQIYIFYRDMRTYGFREGLYRDARRAGVLFIHYEPDELNVERRDGKIVISSYDPVLNRRVGVVADYLVLSTGIQPADVNLQLAKLLKVPLNEDGFFLEAHMKLRPVDFNTAGIFMAGICHSPRFISETIAQALAAAARAGSVISQDQIMTSAVVARVNTRWCAGCGICERICQYEAVRINPETGKSEVTAVLCQGCGACAAACPSSAIELQGFESRQLLAMVEEAL
uniref:FAD-binding protein n=1 Tax=candidate division WOR-3 bacterium TaxID=2052148 RepID=A0A7V3V049_UNCW3